MIDWDKINKLLSSNIDIEEVKNNFKEIGIDVIDEDGNFKCWYKILEEMSEKWNELS